MKVILIKISKVNEFEVEAPPPIWLLPMGADPQLDKLPGTYRITHPEDDLSSIQVRYNVAEFLKTPILFGDGRIVDLWINYEDMPQNISSKVNRGQFIPSLINEQTKILIGTIRQLSDECFMKDIEIKKLKGQIEELATKLKIIEVEHE